MSRQSYPYEELLPIAVKIAPFLGRVGLEPVSETYNIKVTVSMHYDDDHHKFYPYTNSVLRDCVVIVQNRDNRWDSSLYIYPGEGPMKYGCGIVDPRERFRLSEDTVNLLHHAVCMLCDAEENLT